MIKNRVDEMFLTFGNYLLTNHHILNFFVPHFWDVMEVNVNKSPSAFHQVFVNLLLLLNSLLLSLFNPVPLIKTCRIDSRILVSRVYRIKD